MENFSGLTPEEKARLLDLEKSVELDKARPKIKKDFLKKSCSFQMLKSSVYTKHSKSIGIFS